MKFIDWVKEKLMLRYCPGYLELMPEDRPGWYRASAYRHYFGPEIETGAVDVWGLRNAYRAARWLGLKADWFTRSCYGIRWRVREIGNDL